MDDAATLNYISRHCQEHLDQLNGRQAIIRDLVRGVAEHYATGLYLYGRPGTAKIRTVLAKLDEHSEPYQYRRGHLTPIGLFELLEEHPESLIVLDDLVDIFRSDISLQLLLAALESPKTKDRTRVVRY